VYVEGRLQTRSFDDRDGVKPYITEIVADGVILLSGQQGESQEQHASGKGNNNNGLAQPQGRAAAPGAPAADDLSSQGVTDDDIPFGDSGPRGFLTDAGLPSRSDVSTCPRVQLRITGGST
jgi:single-strand DNA-binding protein